MEKKYLTKKEIDAIISFKMTYLDNRREYTPYKFKAIMYLHHLGRLSHIEIERLKRSDFRYRSVVTYRGEKYLPKSVIAACKEYFAYEEEKGNAVNATEGHIQAICNTRKSSMAQPKRYLVI